MYSPTANTRNPAIRRIMADVRELERHPSPRYHAVPLEDNFFEWHFTIRGPSGTDFEGGVYHGRILLPSEYPMKPPNIVFLTRNGRFEVGTKICLSISAHHEESWQPAWGVRTMLEAIISFLPSEGAGAIGALEWSREERQKCARESQAFKCPTCGHAAALLQAEGDGEGEAGGVPAEIAEQIAQLRLQGKPSDEAGGAGEGGDGSDGGGGKVPAAGGGNSPSPASFTFSLTAALTGAEKEAAAAAQDSPAAPFSSSDNPWAQHAEPSSPVHSIALQMPSREPSGQPLPLVDAEPSRPADAADPQAVPSSPSVAVAAAPPASPVAAAQTAATAASVPASVLAPASAAPAPAAPATPDVAVASAPDATPPSLRVIRRRILAERAMSMAAASPLPAAVAAGAAPAAAAGGGTHAARPAAGPLLAAAGGRAAEENDGEQLGGEAYRPDLTDRLLQTVLTVIASVLVLLLSKKMQRFLWNGDDTPDL